MKTIHKLPAILIVLSLLALLAGCGGAANNTTTQPAATEPDTTAAATQPAPTDPPTTPEPTEPRIPLEDLVLSSCDTLDGTKLVKQETSNVKEGTGAWLHEPSGNDLVHFSFAPTDISAYAEEYLSMWVYCSDIDGAGHDGQIELSSNTFDTGELFWSFSDYVYETGWNHVLLPIEYGTPAGDPIDLTAVKFIRLYSLEHTASFIIDDIRLVDRTKAE